MAVMLIYLGALLYNTTIAPPQKNRFFHIKRFIAARNEEGWHAKQCRSISSLPVDYRAMTSGWRGTPCFRRYGRELIPKPAILGEEKVGGLP